MQFYPERWYQTVGTDPYTLANDRDSSEDDPVDLTELRQKQRKEAKEPSENQKRIDFLRRAHG